MTQHYLGQIPDPSQESGNDLAARLNSFDNGHRTNQSGPTRPAGILPGGVWTRVVGGVYDLMLFDGAQDRVVMRGDQNLSGLTDIERARQNLGLGNSATHNLASEAEARAGVRNDRAMSPLRAAQAIAALAIRVPPGATMFFARQTAPDGWLKANGAAISRATYADLFAAIGTTFGAGNGSTTFNLPDLRGEFVRGWDDGRGNDPSRTFGSGQGEGVGKHQHHIASSTPVISGTNLDEVSPNNTVTHEWRRSNWYETYRLIGVDDPADIGLSSETGTESRPRNIALLACIKY